MEIAHIAYILHDLSAVESKNVREEEWEYNIAVF